MNSSNHWAECLKLLKRRKVISSQNLKIKIWDLGGQVQFRPEWKAYAKTCQIVVFVVDISDVRLID